MDDLMFCILHSCKDGLESGRLVYYAYLYKLSGLFPDLRFRLTSTGFGCRGLNEYLDGLVSVEKVKIENGVVSCTDIGFLYYDDIVATSADWDFYDGTKYFLDILSEQELYFICITDMIISDVLKKYGVVGLREKRAEIERSVSALVPEYSKEDFNNAVGIASMFKERDCRWIKKES